MLPDDAAFRRMERQWEADEENRFERAMERLFENNEEEDDDDER